MTLSVICVYAQVMDVVNKLNLAWLDPTFPAAI